MVLSTYILCTWFIFANKKISSCIWKNNYFIFLLRQKNWLQFLLWQNISGCKMHFSSICLSCAQNYNNNIKYSKIKFCQYMCMYCDYIYCIVLWYVCLSSLKLMTITSVRPFILLWQPSVPLYTTVWLVRRKTSASGSMNPSVLPVSYKSRFTMLFCRVSFRGDPPDIWHQRRSFWRSSCGCFYGNK